MKLVKIMIFFYMLCIYLQICIRYLISWLFFSAFQLLAVPGNTVEKIAMAMPEIFKDLHLNKQLCHKVFAEGMTLKNDSLHECLGKEKNKIWKR